MEPWILVWACSTKIKKSSCLRWHVESHHIHTDGCKPPVPRQIHPAPSDIVGKLLSPIHTTESRIPKPDEAQCTSLYTRIEHEQSVTLVTQQCRNRRLLHDTNLCYSSTTWRKNTPIWLLVFFCWFCFIAMIFSRKKAFIGKGKDRADTRVVQQQHPSHETSFFFLLF